MLILMTVAVGTLCMMDQKPRGGRDALRAAEWTQFQDYAMMVRNEVLRIDSEKLLAGSIHSLSSIGSLARENSSKSLGDMSAMSSNCSIGASSLKKFIRLCILDNAS